METKIIIQALKCCHNLDECDDCGYNELGEFCDELLKRYAAERLEELDAELEKRTINDRPYEWISMEDERKPKEGESCIVRSSTGCITIRKYEKGGFPDNHRIRYWIHNPALPKPKEPTFRDVFLKAFPKAPLGYNGAIKLCARNVFPQINCSLSNGCAECWKQTYFEGEGWEE